MSDFAALYQGVKWMHLRGDENRYAELLQWSSFNDFLSERMHSLQYPAVRVVLDGRVLPESSIVDASFDERGNPTRSLSPGKIKSHSASGATLVISGLEGHVRPIRTLVQGLATELSEDVRANAYFSPGGRPGFQVHYDSHDVLILQVEGKKSWRLYGINYPWPLGNQSYLDVSPPEEEATQLTISKGDLLYIPRGLWHSAVAREAEPSLHLTIGIYRKTRIDFVSWIVRQLEGDPSVREDAANAFDRHRLAASIAVIKNRLDALFADPVRLESEYDCWHRSLLESQNEAFSFPDSRQG